MKVLIKLGGALVDDSASRERIAREIAQLAHGPYKLVIVHGGGKQVTRFLEERGIKSQFINGLRVSDENVIDAVTQVIAGGVNKRLTASFHAAGIAALGISGVDGGLTIASQLDPELGFVGEPAETNGHLLDLLSNAGYLPLVACIAGDGHGRIFNVNADRMVVSCATGWQAEKLLFLTDVPGVKDGQGEIMSRLEPQDIRALIDSGAVHGGMQAKLEAAQIALHHGIQEVVIASGAEPNVCARLLEGELLGTRLSSTFASKEVTA